MTLEEVAKFLTVAAVIDPRITVSVEGVKAWHALIGGIAYEDAQTAFLSHYRESAARLMPVDVIEGAEPLVRAREDAARAALTTRAEKMLCLRAGVPIDEFVERRGETEWVAYLWDQYPEPVLEVES